METKIKNLSRLIKRAKGDWSNLDNVQLIALEAKLKGVLDEVQAEIEKRQNSNEWVTPIGLPEELR